MSACLYTWTDVVNHQCQRSGPHRQHMCPCGAQALEGTGGHEAPAAGSHVVEVDRYRHGASGSYRWRAECSCGWIGGIADHLKTAEGDGAEHVREVTP